MVQTKLLPPESAVRMTWAQTSVFSVGTELKKSLYLIGPEFSKIKEKAEKDPKEQEYVFQALAAMNSSLRNLNVVYNWRNLNFDENRVLRNTYSELIKAYTEFGTKARDYIISLPATLLGSAAGIALSEKLLLSGFPLWELVLVLSIIGFVIGHVINLGIIKYVCIPHKQRLYIQMDYERSLYYKRYLFQVGRILNDLYTELDRIHEKIFSQKYPADENVKGKDIVGKIIDEIDTKFYCPHIHDHMSRDPEHRKQVTADMWPRCETGLKGFTDKCTHWEGGNKVSCISPLEVE
ncbi:MAG: hypothetical protein KAR56_02100 [Thermoplasmata archaeon]|nr:hypothetical protein [Thermoplasmata archaeon]